MTHKEPTFFFSCKKGHGLFKEGNNNPISNLQIYKEDAY